MIYGTGVDIVKIERIKLAIKRSGVPFLNRVFTDREILYCTSMKNPYQHFAGIFAVKEAVLKGFDMGWYSTNWRNIEVIHEKNGRPKVKVYNKMNEEKEKKEIKNIHISISHDSENAIAFSIMEGK